jgi:hypothetical protein
MSYSGLLMGCARGTANAKAPPLTPPPKRTSSYMGKTGRTVKKSGLPMFWQIAQSVRGFLLSSHKEATTAMVVETQSPKKALRFPARAAGIPGVAAMGIRVGRRSPRTHH